MAVKYVKDFSFPASGGFHGDVQRFAKGGHVTKVPAKAKASAKDMPARANPNASARGAPKMESKPAKGKRQGYNEGGRVPGYDMDRLPAKKPPGRTMDLASARRFKGAYEGYADGGDVVEYDRPPSTLGSPVGPPRGFKVNPNYGKPGEDYYIPENQFPLPLEPEPGYLIPQLPEPRYMRDVETRLDRGMRPGQMARQQRIENRVNYDRDFILPEEPNYLIPSEPLVPSNMIPGMAMVAPPSPGRYAKGGKVQKVMREYKEGKLHSGSKKGPVVKNRKQAVAIALSEARKAGAKIPKKGEGGEIFSTEYLAYGNKKGPYRGSPKKAKMLGRQDRRAREAMERAEKKAPGLSLDMPDRRKHGGMPVHRRKPMYGSD